MKGISVWKVPTPARAFEFTWLDVEIKRVGCAYPPHDEAGEANTTKSAALVIKKPVDERMRSDAMISCFVLFLPFTMYVH
jgi:hypothetical protein